MVNRGGRFVAEVEVEGLDAALGIFGISGTDVVQLEISAASSDGGTVLREVEFVVVAEEEDVAFFSVEGHTVEGASVRYRVTPFAGAIETSKTPTPRFTTMSTWIFKLK